MSSFSDLYETVSVKVNFYTRRTRVSVGVRFVRACVCACVCDAGEW